VSGVALPVARSRAFVTASLRAIWFVLLPALLAVLALRYLIPSVARAPEGTLRAISEWAEAQQSTLAVAFFLLFTAVIRYWRRLLPGAELWTEPAARREAQTARGTLLWLCLLLVAGITAFVFRTSFFQSYRVLSGSMLPTLQPGETLLAKQYAYGFHWPWLAPNRQILPRRGDLVVFRRPPIGPDVPEELVKRVIGLPGDTITTYGASVSINGWQIPSCSVGPYVFIAGDGMLHAQLRMEYLDDAVYLTAIVPALPERGEPYAVKAGEVFVLGDNRNNSSDSRAWNNGHGGGLSIAEIFGKIERSLVGVHRDGRSDFSRLLRPLAIEVRAEGIDGQELSEGIARCLKDRPKQTHPPRPEESKP